MGVEANTASLSPRCHEPASGQALTIERCREDTKWAFVRLVIGIPLPVPYWRFRTFQEYEVREVWSLKLGCEVL
jgi:hypothetical protein